jgi:NADH-quinone oxidoreductase B subunit
MVSILSKAIDWGLRKSPWIIHFNAGACNGCDIEVVDALTPRYDVERFGILQQGTPRHADVLVCTGAVTLQTRDRLRQIYEQMPQPKFVIAVGACACTGGIFDGCYCVAGGIDSAIPVDIYVPGCAARPEALLDAVVKLLGGLEQLQRAGQKLAEESAPHKKPAEDVLDTPAYEVDPQRLFTWQQIASTWAQMSEEEKSRAAELWRSLPDEEKEAALYVAGPLIDGYTPFAMSEAAADIVAKADTVTLDSDQS